MGAGQLVSPNVEEGTTFADAIKALGSERHATYHRMADDIIGDVISCV
jgi:hypothetical protein